MDTAIGALSIAKQALAEALAACTAFQSLCGVNNANDALERIHFDWLPAPAGAEYTLAELQNYRPFARIITPKTRPFTLSKNTAMTYAGSGRLGLVIEVDTYDDFLDDASAAQRRFENTLISIASDQRTDQLGLAELAASGNYRDFRDIECLEIGRSEEEDHPTQGDYLYAVLLVTWGNR